MMVRANPNAGPRTRRARPDPAHLNRTGPTELEAKVAARLPESERALLKYLPGYQSALIVLWAMREAVAIFGLMLAILTRNLTIILRFAAAALALVAMAPPRLVEFLEGMKSQRQHP